MLGAGDSRDPRRCLRPPINDEAPRSFSTQKRMACEGERGRQPPSNMTDGTDKT